MRVPVCFTAPLFALDSDTGEITVAPGTVAGDLDQETGPNSYELIVGVADSGSPSLRGGKVLCTSFSYTYMYM